MSTDAEYARRRKWADGGPPPLGVSMRVLVPAVPGWLHPQVVPAILEAGRVAVVEPIEPANVTHYAWLVRHHWRLHAMASEPLTIVEHDVVVDAGILNTFDACEHPWCCFPYNDHHLLGCTRFRPSALSGVDPAAFVETWLALDQNVSAVLHAAGHRPHVHRDRRPVHHHGWVGPSGSSGGS